jgi:hypothetical protein
MVSIKLRVSVRATSAQKADSGDDMVCLFVESVEYGALKAGGKSRDHVNVIASRCANREVFAKILAAASLVPAGKKIVFTITGSTYVYDVASGKQGVRNVAIA